MHPSQLCDNITDCLLYGDDELFCDYKSCPDTCTCSGFSVHCINYDESNYTLPILSLHVGKQFVSVVSLNGYTINSKQNDIFRNLSNVMMIYLINCTFEDVAVLRLFENLAGLQLLSFINTNVPDIHSEFFCRLGNLLKLELWGSYLNNLHYATFLNLTRINEMDLSGSSLHAIADGSFCELFNITTLNLTSNMIKVLRKDSFMCLTSLIRLYLTNNSIDSIEENSIHFKLFTDIGGQCCYAQVESHQLCSVSGLQMTVKDLSNTYCKLLISRGYYVKISLWVAALIVTFSNALALKINLVKLKKKDRVYLMNLAISDLTVAIYIVIALLNDFSLSGNYIATNIYLDTGILCRYTGFAPMFFVLNSASGFCLLTLKQLFATRFHLGTFTHLHKVEFCLRYASFLCNSIVSFVCTIAIPIWNPMCLLPYESTHSARAVSIALLIIYPICLMCLRLWMYKSLISYVIEISKIQTDALKRRANNLRLLKRVALILISHILFLVCTSLIVFLPIALPLLQYEIYTLISLACLFFLANLNPLIYTFNIKDAIVKVKARLTIRY